MATVVLTKGQQTTLDRLLNDDFKPIKQADITRLLSKMLDTEQTAKEIIPKIITYERIKFPKKSVNEIEKYLTKKIKDKNDRMMFREVLSKGDYSSFPEVDKEVNNKVTTDPVVKDPKSNKELNDLLDKLLSGSDDKTKEDSLRSKEDSLRSKEDSLRSKEKDPFEGRKPTGKIASTKDEDDMWNYIDTTSKIYKDNKKTIDNIVNSINEKSINDGSWLTTISSMEIPEIKIWQELIKNTPLSFDKTNDSDLQKILEGKEDLDNPYSTILKLFVNPDKVGQLATGRFKQAGEDISEFIQKLTGTYSEPVNTTALDAKNTLDVRKKEEEEKQERQRAIAKLRGDEPIVPEQTMPSDEYLKVPSLGYKPNTAWEDIKQFLGNIFTPQQLKKYGTQKEFENELKRKQPDKFKEYENALDLYNYKVRKIKLTEDSNIDKYDFSKVQSVASLVDRMLREASSAKDLTNSQIEEIYDIHSTLSKASSGAKSITYKQLGQLLNFLPQDMITKYGGDEWTGYIDYLKKSFGQQVAGDSDLSGSIKVGTDSSSSSSTDTTIEQKTEDDKETKEEEDPDPDPEPEKTIPTQNIPAIVEKPLDTGVSNFSTLRPRMMWGDTDSLFFRKKDEVAQANLIAESMSLDTGGYGNGVDNPLYKKNLIQDQMRYGRTFSMPPPPPKDPLELPSRFSEMTKPIMISQYADIGRTPDNYGRDPYLFGQFSNFTPAYQQTVYPSVEQKINVNEYPYIADIQTGGENQTVKRWDYLENLRFTQG